KRRVFVNARPLRGSFSGHLSPRVPMCSICPMSSQDAEGGPVLPGQGAQETDGDRNGIGTQQPWTAEGRSGQHRTGPHQRPATPGEPPTNLGRPDVRRLKALLALVDFELDDLALSQRLEASPRNPGVVYEDVFAIILRDEPETLLVAEPLH